MAGKSAILAVKIISDASQAGRGFADAEKATGRFAGGLEKANRAAVGVMAGVAALGVAAFNSASELQQQAGAVEAVFNREAAAVQKLADTAADRVGLAASEYDRFASLIGSQLKNAGVPAGELVGETEDLIAMGADLAAQFGGSTADAVSALSSLLRGERDPIERYAVSINQAAIDAELAARGQDKLTGAAKKNAEAQATLTLLTQQTASAHGAFAREADTAAGQQQRATAQFENASAALGEALLPLVADAAAKLAVVAEWVSKNSELVVPFVVVLGTLAAAIWLVNIALAMNPFVLLAIAIAAVIAAVVACYMKFEGFRNVVDAIGRFFARVFDPFLKVFRDLWNGITNAGSAFDVFKTLATTALNIILAPLRTVWNIIQEIGKGIAKIPGVSRIISAFTAPGPPGGDDADPTFGRGGSGAPPGPGPLFAAADGPAGGSGGSVAFDPAAEPVGDTYVFNFSGVIGDPDALAAKIQKMLDRHRERTGLAGTSLVRR